MRKLDYIGQVFTTFRQEIATLEMLKAHNVKLPQYYRAGI
jgi:hypothetical protein